MSLETEMLGGLRIQHQHRGNAKPIITKCSGEQQIRSLLETVGRLKSRSGLSQR